MKKNDNEVSEEKVLLEIAHNPSSDLYLSSGKRLKKARCKMGYSQYGLAQLVRNRGLRCSDNYIGQLERGKRNMSEQLAVCIGKILRVSADYLLCRSSYKSNEEMLDAIVQYAFEDHRTEEQKRHDRELNIAASILSEFGFEFLTKIDSNLIITGEEKFTVECAEENGFCTIEVTYKEIENFLSHVSNMIRFEISEFTRIH